MRWMLHIAVTHLAFFAWVSMPSRLAMNLALWIAGLVLQSALVLVVFRRGVARGFPFFAALICFYPLRSSLLYVLANRVDADVYGPLFSGLAILEILFEAAVAVELMRRINQQMNVGSRWSKRRGWLAPHILFGLVLASVAGGLTWLELRFTPVSVPVDRIQVFIWFAMIGLFAVALKFARSTNAMRIAAGFAAFAVIQLAASFGRAQAVLKHDAFWYLGWSYAPAIGYLCVVIFWIVSLHRER